MTCALWRALNSHTQESCWSRFGAHTLPSGLGLVWCSILELQSQFMFAGDEIHFTASVSQPLMSEHRAWHQPFIPDRTPLVPREQTAGGPYAHPEIGVL